MTIERGLYPSSKVKDNGPYGGFVIPEYPFSTRDHKAGIGYDDIDRKNIKEEARQQREAMNSSFIPKKIF